MGVQINRMPDWSYSCYNSHLCFTDVVLCLSGWNNKGQGSSSATTRYVTVVSVTVGEHVTPRQFINTTIAFHTVIINFDLTPLFDLDSIHESLSILNLNVVAVWKYLIWQQGVTLFSFLEGWTMQNKNTNHQTHSCRYFKPAILGHWTHLKCLFYTTASANMIELTPHTHDPVLLSSCSLVLL